MEPSIETLIEMFKDEHVNRAADQRISWDFESWSDTLSGAESVLWSRVHPALENLEDHWALDYGLSRSAIVNSATTRDGGKSVDPVALLVTSMAFGYGGLSYGPARVLKMLASPDIERSSSDIFAAAQDDPRSAFQALFHGRETRITGLGASMGSKFLRFASSSLVSPSRSLINDENVYHAMKSLGLDVAANPRLAFTDEYVRAVSWMHGAASDINSQGGAKRVVSGDDVEYALFQYERWKRRKDRLERNLGAITHEFVHRLHDPTVPSG